VRANHVYYSYSHSYIYGQQRVVEPHPGGVLPNIYGLHEVVPVHLEWKFTWNGTQYVLVGGDTCGGDCHCPNPPGNLRKLLILEGKLKTYDSITLSCCAGGCNVLEPAIGAYIKLLIAFKLLLRIAAGLGLLGVVLAGIIVYLLAR
jgi:hypothetical protein